MAKKNKRPTTQNTSKFAAELAERLTAKSPAASTEFNPDYTNVKKDLARIGILAGTFFVVLIVLSFIIK